MFKKVFSILLAVTLMLGSSNVVLASTTTENDSLQSTVTMQVASSWVVTVPDGIEMGETNTVEYEASLAGDVAIASSVSIVPASTITLTDGFEEITATVIQEKQEWTGAEITEEGVTTTGTISIADDVPAGTWVGTLDFAVVCSESVSASDLYAKFDKQVIEAGYDLEGYDYEAVYVIYSNGELVSTRKYYSTTPITACKPTYWDKNKTYYYLVNESASWSFSACTFESSDPMICCNYTEETYNVSTSPSRYMYETDTAVDSTFPETYAGSGIIYANHDILYQGTEDIFYAKTE